MVFMWDLWHLFACTWNLPHMNIDVICLSQFSYTGNPCFVEGASAVMGNSPKQWAVSYAPTLRREKAEAAVKLMGTSLPRSDVASTSSNLSMYLREEEDQEFEEEEYEQAEGGEGGVGFNFEGYEGQGDDAFGEDGEGSSEGGDGWEQEDGGNVGVSSSKRKVGGEGGLGQKHEGQDNVGEILDDKMLGGEDEGDVVVCKLKRRLLAQLA